MRFSSFIATCIASLLIPAIILSPLYGLQSDTALQKQHYQDPLNTEHLITYDEVLQYLADIESGALEPYCNEYDLARINAWLVYLAKAGVIPGDTQAESLLEIDIEDLGGEGSYFAYGADLGEETQCMLIPTLQHHAIEAFLCKSWLTKKWKQTKKFIKQHKKELLIGAAVVVGAVVVVAAVSYSTALAAGAASAAARHSAMQASAVMVQAEEIRQDVLSQDLTALSDPSFPMEENARILGHAGAQAALEKWQSYSTYCPFFASDEEKAAVLDPQRSHFINEAFSQTLPWNYAHSSIENVYAARGSYASDIKLYDQAHADYDKALQINPSNSDVYLSRALTYFETGQIDKATRDFQKHIELRKEPLQEMKDFSKGFVKGLGKGVKDSGMGLYAFTEELIFHPISTAAKMYEAGEMLFALTKSSQWHEIAKALSSEAYTLATDWEHLSLEKRGELSGYVFGKHGADLLLPGAGIKLTKGAIGELKVLATAANTAAKAEKALVLESVVLGTGKIADASFGVKTATGLLELGEVGFVNHVEHLKTYPFNFTDTTLKHMQNPQRWVPTSLIKEVIEHPMAVVPDPRKAANANMYYSQISKNGKLYNIEVLYDPIENKISHFKYTDDAVGPLNKIRK